MDLVTLRAWAGESSYRVEALAELTPDSALVRVYGGTRPHIGATAVYTPDGAEAAAVQLPGHRELDLARELARAFAAATGRNVTAVMGVHVDGAGRDEVGLLSGNIRAAGRALLRKTLAAGNGQGGENAMELLDGLCTRRSIRRYQDRPVGERELQKLLTAGMCAPSARDGRPWEFLVITRRELLDALSRVRPYWGMLAQAPLAILVLGRPEGYAGSSPGFLSQDCAAAAENILLAAHGLGLGGVWLGLHPLEEPQRRVRELLRVPEALLPFALLSLGWPVESRDAPDRFDGSRVHRETF